MAVLDAPLDVTPLTNPKACPIRETRPQMPRRYTILDVFTDRPLAGNPLAVVLDGDGLDDASMQSVAREFNVSETVFIGPPENPAHSAKIRIFTPASEL